MKRERQKQLDLIWKHTHRDYRGKIGAERAILVFRTGEGTCSVTLDGLTEAEFADKLAYAQRKEKQQEAA